METKQLIEEGERLVIECRQLLAEVKMLVDEEISHNAVIKYKNIADELRRDNERLYRENQMLKSSLQI